MKNLKFLSFFEKFIGLSYFKYPVNTRLQGKDQLINKMYDHISAFQMKLALWEQQKAADKIASLISDLNLEFENRFQDF